MPIAHYHNYRFDVPEADRLASLAGAEFDLRAVVEFCKRLESLIEGQSVDVELYDALSVAAVVRYGRCFNSGVRERLPINALANAPDDCRNIHTFIVTLRNKHVAHSVNSFEETNVTLQIAEHYTSSSQIEFVNTAHGRAVGFPFDLPTRVRHLANWWLGWLKKEMVREKQNLVELARTKPLEELKKNEQGVLAADTAPDTVGKRRRNP